MKMEFRVGLGFFTVCVLCLAVVYCEEGKKCNPKSLLEVPCPLKETCTPALICECVAGYRRESSSSVCTLVPTTLAPTAATTETTTTEAPSHAEKIHQSSVSTGAFTAAVLVPIVLITIGLLVLLGRRYRWFERLQHLRGRRYEEVRIGHEDDEDDDPPLA